MKKQRRAVSLVTVAALAMVGLVACSDVVTGPRLSADAELEAIRGAVQALQVVEREEPGMRRAVARAWIGPDGGSVAVGGVELRVPRGAVSEAHRIALVVPAGRYVQAHLFPHGLEFHRPLELEFSLEGTTVSGNASAVKSLLGVYFEGAIRGGVVTPAELVPITVVEGSETVVLQIDHFSGYTPAGG